MTDREDDEKALDALLDRLPAPEMPQGLAARIARTVTQLPQVTAEDGAPAAPHAANDAEAAPHRRARWPLWAGGAGMALAAGLALAVILPRGAEPQPPAPTQIARERPDAEAAPTPVQHAAAAPELAEVETPRTVPAPAMAVAPAVAPAMPSQQRPAPAAAPPAAAPAADVPEELADATPPADDDERLSNGDVDTSIGSTPAPAAGYGSAGRRAPQGMGITSDSGLPDLGSGMGTADSPPDTGFRSHRGGRPRR